MTEMNEAKVNSLLSLIILNYNNNCFNEVANTYYQLLCPFAIGLCGELVDKIRLLTDKSSRWMVLIKSNWCEPIQPSAWESVV